jgi:hypothetical protein
MRQRKAEAGDSFDPMLSATTKNLGDKVEIRIRDNGTKGSRGKMLDAGRHSASTASSSPRPKTLHNIKRPWSR